MNLIELQNKIHKNAKEKGFWDMEHNFGNDLMLIVGELGECSESHRKGINADLTSFEDALEHSNLTYDKAFEKYVKDTVGDELADALIRILDCAAGWEIDIITHINYKMKYNSNREYLHGKKY